MDVERLESRALLSGLGPAGLRRALGVPAVAAEYGPAAAGAGVTIAVVDAYHDPSAARDLLRYSRRYGLPRPELDVVNLGAPGNTAGPTGWSTEIALDLEAIHALLPLAKIDLVEARSNATVDLVAAERCATGLPGVAAVSNSWGAPGDLLDSFGLDAYAGAFDGGPRVAVAAAAGDSAGPLDWPARMPGVISVAGMAGHAHNRPWLSYDPPPDVRVAVGGPPGLHLLSGGAWSDAWGTSLSCPAFVALVGAADGVRLARGEPTLGTADVRAALDGGVVSAPGLLDRLA